MAICRYLRTETIFPGLGLTRVTARAEPFAVLFLAGVRCGVAA
jgi:hypothetical protein